MTVSECLTLTDTLCPNVYDASVKKHWLAGLEGRICTELLGGEPGSGLPLPVSGELTVPAPFDGLYPQYLCAMLAEAAGDTARYRNDAALFNASYAAYAKHVIRTRAPERD